nr:barstar family protein [Sedimentibacter sp.]
MEIILDGKLMTDKTAAHKYIKEQLDFPGYYGENLDALWDVLSTTSKSITIYLINEHEITERLGEYGKLLLGVFQDASFENDNLCFIRKTDNECEHHPSK